MSLQKKVPETIFLDGKNIPVAGLEDLIHNSNPRAVARASEQVTEFLKSNYLRPREDNITNMTFSNFVAAVIKSNSWAGASLYRDGKSVFIGSPSADSQSVSMHPDRVFHIHTYYLRRTAAKIPERLDLIPTEGFRDAETVSITLAPMDAQGKRAASVSVGYF